MSDDNIYSAPESDLVKSGELQQKELASRWTRLFASILDSIIMMIILIPIWMMSGFMDGMLAGSQPSFAENLVMAIVGIIVFVAVNGVLLLRHGQTVGKKVLGIAITDLEGRLPELKTYLVRYAVFFLPQQLPIIGQLFALVNILFIFGKEKRCIHDHAAGTKVVKL